MHRNTISHGENIVLLWFFDRLSKLFFYDSAGSRQVPELLAEQVEAADVIVLNKVSRPFS